LRYRILPPRFVEFAAQIVAQLKVGSLEGTFDVVDEALLIFLLMENSKKIVFASFFLFTLICF
jgi:hypothetical protein